MCLLLWHCKFKHKDYICIPLKAGTCHVRVMLLLPSLGRQSTCISQSEPGCKIQNKSPTAAFILRILSPSLKNLMPMDCDSCYLLALTFCRLVHFVISVRTLSYLHFYWPFPGTLWHPVKMWFRIQNVSTHCLEDEPLSLTHILRLFRFSESTGEKGQVSQIYTPQQLVLVLLYPSTLASKPYFTWQITSVEL